MSTIFIGDIHGCAQELEQLLNEVGYAESDDRLLLTGDAFSRGPLPLRVWEIIRETGTEMVLGNHDDRLLRQLTRSREGRDIDFAHDDQRFTFDQLSTVAGPLLRWLSERPLWVDEAAFLLVHAGINPADGLEQTTRKELLTIRTWPPVKGVVGPRWHDVVDPGDLSLIVFGHDAPGGLVFKKRDGDEGRPYILGLDSGCVYGGSLSAYILEDNRIVQVASRQPGVH